jgi:Holliday junction resolvase RusA-like endonuclease
MAIYIRIPLLCRSKKNSEQLVPNPKTGKTMIIQSKLYYQFERDCGYFLKKYAKHIDYPVNLKCTFYVPTKHRRDLANLLNAIQDVLVKYGVIEDDNYNIVRSVDGSRIIYSPRREETIIEIEELKDE